MAAFEIDELRGLICLEALEGGVGELARHLLSGCPECRGSLRPWADEGPTHPGPLRWQSFARDAEYQIRRDREIGDEAVERLRSLPAGRQTTLLNSSRRLAVPPLVDYLLESAKAHLSSDVEEAQRLAGLAIELADRLELNGAWHALGRDLQARARVGFARALRRGSDLRGADRTLREAERCLEEGSGDLMEEAALLEELAQLRANQRRFAEANLSLSRAERIHKELSDEHAQGRVLARRATVHGQEGQPEKAIPLLERASRLVNPSREPRWVLAIRHNQALYLAESGEAEKALRVLAEAEPIYRELGKPADLLKLRWTQGKILLERGRLVEAAGRFLEVRDGMVALKLPYEAALSSLELALTYAQLGCLDELKRLASEALPVFEALEVDRETAAALLCLRQVAEAETISAELVLRLAAAIGWRAGSSSAS